MRSSSIASQSPFEHRQQAIAVLQPEVFDLDVRLARATADGIREDVLQVLSGALHGLEPVCGREAMLQRLVGGQWPQLTVAEQIRARMTDVCHEQPIAGAVGRGQRRRHLAERVIGPAAANDSVVDLPIEPFGAFEHLLGRAVVDAHVPMPVVQREVRQRAHRDPARDRAAAVSAETVGEQQRIPVFVEARREVGGRQARDERFLTAAKAQRQIVLVVVGARRPDLGVRTDLDLGHRGRWPERLRSQQRRKRTASRAIRLLVVDEFAVIDPHVRTSTSPHARRVPLRRRFRLTEFGIRRVYPAATIPVDEASRAVTARCEAGADGWRRHGAFVRDFCLDFHCRSSAEPDGAPLANRLRNGVSDQRGPSGWSTRGPRGGTTH